ncbi:unnamed protein product [Mucor hiemalis]
MKYINFTSLNFPYRLSTTKRDINYLGLINCTLQYNDVFEVLSNLFPNIRLMEIAKVAYMTSDPERKRMYTNIKMMETKIETLCISKSSSYGRKPDVKPTLDEESLVLVSILLEHVQTYYYYDFRDGKDYKFNPMGVEYFVNCRNYRSHTFLVNIQCKSLGTLIVNHRGKDIRLYINGVQ